MEVEWHGIVPKQAIAVLHVCCTDNDHDHEHRNVHTLFTCGYNGNIIYTQLCHIKDSLGSCGFTIN